MYDEVAPLFLNYPKIHDMSHSSSKNLSYVRPFLKWPGGKYRLLSLLHIHLPTGRRLIEPFVGSGSVFLNSNFNKFLLGDSNADLIALYQLLKTKPDFAIREIKKLFIEKNNTKIRYYEIRELFNESHDAVLRSILFVYLNRHGFNGLCRYNNQGGFNVPFGSYIKPYFPEKEMLHFAEKAQKADFICTDFEQILKKSKNGDVIYCDPPYLPLTKTSQFTQYYRNNFNMEHQIRLADFAKRLSAKGNTVLISNHDTPAAKKLYHGSQMIKVAVRRTISCKKERNLVQELLAIFPGKIPQ